MLARDCSGAACLATIVEVIVVDGSIGGGAPGDPMSSRRLCDWVTRLSMSLSLSSSSSTSCSTRRCFGAGFSNDGSTMVAGSLG
jgi:hypothetical protein